MRLKCVYAVAVSFLFIAMLNGSPGNADSIDLVAKFKENSIAHLDKAVAIAEELRGQPLAQQDENQAALCLVEYTWAVYEAIEAYSMENHELPVDLPSLVSSGHLREWPSNPFNDWQPITMQASSEVFSPGALVWDICPSDCYSRVWKPGGFVNKPLSYQLTVLGPVVDHPYTAKIEPLKGNTWFNAPSGALMTLGSFTETATQSAEKRAKRGKAGQSASQEAQK